MPTISSNRMQNKMRMVKPDPSLSVASCLPSNQI